VKILLDHCLPRTLKRLLIPHTVSTAAEMGWDRLRNGKLLAESSHEFDAVLTIDKNLKHEQNLTALPIAVVVILAPSNRLKDIAPFVPSVLQALSTLPACTLVEVALSSQD